MTAKVGKVRRYSYLVIVDLEQIGYFLFMEQQEQQEQK